MASYHQMGHDSANLLCEEHLAGYAGAILSPVNETEDKARKEVEQYRSERFEIVFDPQLYYPTSNRGKLPLWDYFPADVDTADRSSSAWWRQIVRRLCKVVQRLQVSAVCSPADVPRVYRPSYYELHSKIAHDLEERASALGVSVLQTLIVRLADIAQSETDRAAEIASIVTRQATSRVYLVLVTDVHPRRELREVEDLKAAMRLIRYLEEAGTAVLVGYASSDVILWIAAGASACATGKFFNLRRFTPSRWAPDEDGGGQLPYWFEEGVMGFLREPDLVRVRNAGFLSAASLSNPYGKEILSRLDKAAPVDKPERPAWLALGWRQFLFWFSDFENRLRTQQTDPDQVLRNAERIANALEDKKILMEERQNDFGWLRPWRRAIPPGTGLLGEPHDHLPASQQHGRGA